MSTGESLPGAVEGAENSYTFEVVMACGGCSTSVEKALKNLGEDVKTDVSLEKQTATVKTSKPYDLVLEKIQKTGKVIRWGVDGEGKKHIYQSEK